MAHSRTKSAPEPTNAQPEFSYKEFNKSNDDLSDIYNSNAMLQDSSRSLESLSNQPENVIRPNNSFQHRTIGFLSNNNSMGSLTGTDSRYYQSNASLGSISSPLNRSNGSISNANNLPLVEDTNVDPNQIPVLPPRSRAPLNTSDPVIEDNELEDIESSRNLGEDSVDGLAVSRLKGRRSKEGSDITDLAYGFRKSLKLDGTQLPQKSITISKSSKESLGMRIGGGVGSNEGDTPIYIANINPQGPVGKSQNVKKGDVLLSVNGQSLLGLTHAQAVAQLKATAELAGVTLSLLDGPETGHSGENCLILQDI